jgi:hypothetical protein
LDIHLRRRPVDSTALVPILSNPETFRRLRSLDFNGHAAWFDQFLEYIVVHNHENVPNLENLRIDISCMGAMSGYETFEGIGRFFSSSFPKLHTLEIINLGIDWNSSFPSLSSITELTVKNPPNVNCPKLGRLLSLLRSNPRINKLILEDGALPPLEDAGDESGFLRLSDLRNLQLTGGLLPIMHLLEHLDLPPELQYASITVDATGYSNEAILPRITPFLHRYYLFENHEERRIDGLRLVLDDLQTTVLTVATTPNAFVVPEPTLSQIPLSPMNLHIQTYQDKRPLSMELFQFLPLENLRDLSLECLELNVQQCQLLFGRVRRVEELCLAAGSGPGAIAALELPGPPGKDKPTGKDKGKAAETPANSKKQKGKAGRGGKGDLQVQFGRIRGLTKRLRSFGGGRQNMPSTSRDARHTIAADSVPLPKLKNLLLHEVVFGPAGGKKLKGIPKNKLGNLLGSRKKAGYGLQELAIQTCVGFGAGQVKVCEKFVRKVVWDGDEGKDLTHGCTHHHHYRDHDDLSPSEEYDAHYQIYGRGPWDVYDSDSLDEYLPYF